MAHRIISQLSPLHYRTTKYLLDFLSLMTKPEISSKTKMNASNLALVFSPCFLRPPTTDIKLNFANAPKEQEFIATLLLNPPK
ncbi:Mental retardation GTPase activating protein-like protein [Zancudomyces culisetae]|uniref:Mental retardation GTPase activating protein-like protein n=1 Tax=Zancudomyces culisetae TaxID=1213189 RepID=A0A1R1PE51_ZANCU|nr:Mental retardation GTPase activating protein-like protein [Zancudomyces culisetae]|eukprot:OMH79275.1 Mental retardation GTPase activating protein-like protein [Zancudomyces culisetae]